VAVSITDFWRRWHISLSSWLRDYLYIPLGGSRVGRLRANFNLVMTMVIGGIWHGANVTFLIWGIWHGILLVLDKFFGEAMGWARKPMTLLLVFVGWLPFRAANLHETLAIGRGLMGLNGRGGGELLEMFRLDPLLAVFVVAGIAWVFMLEPWLRRYRQNRHWSELTLAQVPSAMVVTLLGLLLISLSFVFSKDAVPFLYFQF